MIYVSLLIGTLLNFYLISCALDHTILDRIRNAFPLQEYPTEYQARILYGHCINPAHFLCDSTTDFFHTFYRHLSNILSTQNSLKKSIDKVVAKGWFNCEYLDIQEFWEMFKKDKRFRGMRLFLGTLFAQDGDIFNQQRAMFTYYAIQKILTHTHMIQDIKNFEGIAEVSLHTTVFIENIVLEKLAPTVKTKSKGQTTGSLLADAQGWDTLFPMQVKSFLCLMVGYCQCKKKMSAPISTVSGYTGTGVTLPLIPFKPQELLPIHRVASFEDPLLLCERINQILPLLRSLTMIHGFQCLRHFFPSYHMNKLKFPFRIKVRSWNYESWGMQSLREQSKIDEKEFSLVAYSVECVEHDQNLVKVLKTNPERQIIAASYYLSCVWSYPQNGQKKPKRGDIYEPNEELASLLVFIQDTKVSGSAISPYLSLHFLPWLCTFQSVLLLHLYLMQLRIRAGFSGFTEKHLSTHVFYDVLSSELVDIIEFPLSDDIVMTILEGSLYDTCKHLMCIESTCALTMTCSKPSIDVVKDSLPEEGLYFQGQHSYLFVFVKK